MISWETKAARKIKKKARNKTPKDRNKSHKTSRISSPKESLDGSDKMTVDAMLHLFMDGTHLLRCAI